MRAAVGTANSITGFPSFDWAYFIYPSAVKRGAGADACTAGVPYTLGTPLVWRS